MSNFSEEREEILKQIGWCQHAIDYVYSQCDENSEFFEPVSDAWLLIHQLKTEAEKLFQKIEQASLSLPNTPTLHNE